MLIGYEIEFDGLLLTLKQNINVLTNEKIHTLIKAYSGRHSIDYEKVLEKVHNCLQQSGIDMLKKLGVELQIKEERKSLPPMNINAEIYDRLYRYCDCSKVKKYQNNVVELALQEYLDRVAPETVNSANNSEI
jgi:hypothetical protein